MDPRVDALYDLPAGEFVAARDALAKALRAEGDKAQAAEVKALARPSAAAAAVNALARSGALDDLWAAAEASDTRGVRRAIDAAVSAATGSGTVVDRVRETLQAAAADPGVREAVRAGRLEKEVGAGEVDPFAAFAASLGGAPLAGAGDEGGGTATKRTKPAPGKKAARPKGRSKADVEAERAAQRRAALEERLADARAILEQARADDEAAAARAEAERKAFERAREAAERARAEAAAAQKAHRDAAVEAERIGEARQKAERAVTRLEEQLAD